MTGGNFLIYRIPFKPYAAQQKAGGVIIFEKLIGKAEIWLDNKLLAKKTMIATGNLTVNFPPISSETTLNVLIEDTSGSKAGLGGIVKVKE